MALALKRAMAQEDRITDAYINEVMELDRYKAEMDRLRARRQELECVARGIAHTELEELDRRAALEHLERFCLQVSKGLETMSFEECQHLLRLLVERITVEDGHVRIETVIPTTGDEGYNCAQVILSLSKGVGQPARGEVPGVGWTPAPFPLTLSLSKGAAAEAPISAGRECAGLP